MLTWSAVALAGSFAGAVWGTRQHGGVASACMDIDVPKQNLLGVKALLSLPLALLCFEALALFQLNAVPYQVSWINLAFAGYLGQNLEALSRLG